MRTQKVDKGIFEALQFANPQNSVIPSISLSKTLRLAAKRPENPLLDVFYVFAVF